MEGEKISEEAERSEDEEEGEFIGRIDDPILPSKEEIENHNLSGHVDFRNWC